MYYVCCFSLLLVILFFCERADLLMISKNAMNSCLECGVKIDLLNKWNMSQIIKINSGILACRIKILIYHIKRYFSRFRFLPRIFFYNLYIMLYLKIRIYKLRESNSLFVIVTITFIYKQLHSFFFS